MSVICLRDFIEHYHIGLTYSEHNNSPNQGSCYITNHGIE